MSARAPDKLYLITEKQRDAFVRWAEESLKPEGLTGWGELFDGAMHAAQELRDKLPPAWPTPAEEPRESSAASLVSYWSTKVTAAITDTNLLLGLLKQAWERVRTAETQLAILEVDDVGKCIAQRGIDRAQDVLRVLRRYPLSSSKDSEE